MDGWNKKPWLVFLSGIISIFSCGHAVENVLNKTNQVRQNTDSHKCSLAHLKTLTWRYESASPKYKKKQQTKYVFATFSKCPWEFCCNPSFCESVSNCVSCTSTPQTQLPIKLTVNVQHHFKTDWIDKGCFFIYICRRVEVATVRCQRTTQKLYWCPWWHNRPQGQIQISVKC